MTEYLNKKVKDLKIGELEKLIEYANKEYRNGVEVMGDEIYDRLIARLKALKPDSRFLREIGAPVRDELVKEKLPFWMGSMDNSIFPDIKPIMRWLKKYNGPFFCSGKLDGASALYSRTSGPKLYTRGDGKVGQDITYLLKYLKLPKIDEGDFIRGELIMKESVFKEKYSHEFPKARSVISGTINSKKPNPKILADIDFVAFEYIDTDPKDAKEQFEILRKKKFKIPIHEYLPTLSVEESLIDLFKKFKEDSPYELDGVIIADNHPHVRNTSGNPDYAIAFKMNSDGVKTTIEEVIWDPSMYGVLVPTIRFHTVVIGGDNVSYASAFNAKFVKDYSLRKGTEVLIVKSGDVIPYIKQVLSAGPPSGRKADMPHEEDFGKWHWNESNVDIILDEPIDNFIVRRKRLLRFFTSLGIKYINIGVVKKMITAGISTPQEVYEASIDDLMTLDGVKEKSAKKYYDSIHSVLDRQVPVEKVMKASLCFGSGFGEKILYPVIAGGLLDGSRYPLVEEIKAIEGYSEIMAQKFLIGLKKFRKWLNDNQFIQLEWPSPSSESEGGGPLSDLQILFTGVRNKELTERLKKAGAIINSTFTNKTNLLIIKNKGDNNNKIQRAKTEGIRMIPVDEVEKELFMKG